MLHLPPHKLACRFVGQFQKLQTIGQGTYGIVFFAKDKQTQQFVAVKKMKVFDNNDGFPITSLRQVKILNLLKQHPNIVQLKDVAVGTKKDSVFLVFQYCDIDLYKLIQQMSIDKSYFTEGQIKCIVLQLIKGFSLFRQVMHIKSTLSIVTLNQQICCQTKKEYLKLLILDLPNNFVIIFIIIQYLEIPYKPLTRKVVTLWYRAPELLIKRKQYGPQVDTWSIGCIIGELLQKGNPLFQGADQLNQFKLICELIGYPIKQEWPEFFQQQNRSFRKQVQKYSGSCRTNNLKLFFREYSNNCIDLLGRMICWDSRKRIPLDEALYHPYFYENPKSIFPDEIRVLNKLQFYSKKSNDEVNRKIKK